MLSSSHFFLEDRQQGLRPCVGHNGSENLPDPLEQSRIRPLWRMLPCLAFLCEFLRNKLFIRFFFRTFNHPI